MSRRDPFVSIRRHSTYGGGDAEGPEFIQYVDGREPQIHEVWAFGSNGITREVHPTVQVDVVDGVMGECGRRIPPSWKNFH